MAKWKVTYRDEDGESTDYFNSEKEAQEFIDHCTNRASKHAAEGEKFELVDGPIQIENFSSRISAAFNK